MHIRVGRSYEEGCIYIGRGSPLGNPFRMKNNSPIERERVLKLYKDWLDEKLFEGDRIVINELTNIAELSKKEDVILGCYCHPKKCHGDYIKQVIKEQFL